MFHKKTVVYRTCCIINLSSCRKSAMSLRQQSSVELQRCEQSREAMQLHTCISRRYCCRHDTPQYWTLCLCCRQHYADMIPASATEGILCSKDGQLLEGFISNLFIVQRTDTGLIVRTALDGALAGIKQKAVLDACHLLHIPTQCKASCHQQRHLWVEAFLTNAVRGLRPIKRIVCPAKNAIGWDPWECTLPAGSNTSVFCQLQRYLHSCPQDALFLT